MALAGGDISKLIDLMHGRCDACPIGIVIYAVVAMSLKPHSWWAHSTIKATWSTPWMDTGQHSFLRAKGRQDWAQVPRLAEFCCG
jgi:hypothetical protein